MKKIVSYGYSMEYSTTVKYIKDNHEGLHELIWSDFQDTVLSEKSKVQKSV